MTKYFIENRGQTAADLD